MLSRNVVCLALVAIVVSHFVAAAAAFQIFSPESIPSVLQRTETHEYVRHGLQQGAVSIHASAREMTVEWTAGALVNSSHPPNFELASDLLTNSKGGFRYQGGLQTIPTRFHPTAVCVIDAESVLVAGRSQSGRTVVHRIKFSWPSPMPAPVHDPASGLTSVVVTLPSVASTTKLYESSDGTQGNIRALCALRNGGAAIAALVLFHETNSLYVLDFVSGQLNLLASPSPGAGLLGPISALGSGVHSGISSGARVGSGFSYTLGRGWGGPVQGGSQLDPAQPPIVVLLDANRDGTLDGVLQLSGADYLAQGWSNLQNYESWWLP